MLRLKEPQQLDFDYLVADVCYLFWLELYGSFLMERTWVNQLLTSSSFLTMPSNHLEWMEFARALLLEMATWIEWHVLRYWEKQG